MSSSTATKPITPLTLAQYALGAGVGAVAGYVTYALMALAGDPSRSPLDLLWPPRGTRLVFAAVGMAFGVAVTAELRGSFRLANLLRYVTGIVLGGASGLIMYSVGYVTQNYPGLPTGRHYALYYVEAVYSLTLIEAASVLLGASIGFLMVRYTWRFHGVLAYVSLVSVIGGYLLYAASVTLPQVPRKDLWLSLIIFAAEAASLSLVGVYAFYSLDIFVKKRWRRTPEKIPFSRYYVPKVAFHVTVFNEPTEMVAQTLAALENLDYPKDRYVIMVLDDSTDPACLHALSSLCRQRGHTYIHREDRRGYKAGALNHALKLTPQDVELVAVIDADYQVEPDYLCETVGYFIDANLGFIQTPQDYRNIHQSFLTEQYYYADAYFYRAVLPSRNEENTIIFCGTMGLIRKSVLERVGGWGEAFITEDAELSVRVLERAYGSLYVNKTYGKGIMPATFEAYKKQLYRWSFGGVKVLKAHFGNFLFSHMSIRQKIDFLVGNVHWFDGIFVLTIALAVAAIGIMDFMGIEFMTYHKKEVWLLGLVPIFLLFDGITRLHLALRRSMNLGLLGTIRVMGIWYAIKFNNMFAAFKSLVGFKLPFVRTPKAPSSRMTRWQALRRSVRINKFESFMTLFLLGVAAAAAWRTHTVYQDLGEVLLARVLLVFWLAYYALLFACAPLYAYLAYVTFRTDAEIFPVHARAPSPSAARKA